MSRAFIKESDGAELESLPEIVVSPHRNLVTTEGLRQIETALQRLEAGLSEARAAGDRATVARLERDLRYWRQRRATAVSPLAEELLGCRLGDVVSLHDGDAEIVGIG